MHLSHNSKVVNHVPKKAHILWRPFSQGINKSGELYGKVGNSHFFRNPDRATFMDSIVFCCNCAISFVNRFILRYRQSFKSLLVQDFKTMFPTQDAFTFAIMGMDNLHVAMDKKTRVEFRSFISAINKHES